MNLSAFEHDQTFGDTSTPASITITGRFTDGQNPDGRRDAMATFLTGKGWHLTGLTVNADGSFAASVTGSTTDNLTTVASTFTAQINDETPSPVSGVTASFGVVTGAINSLTGEIDQITAWVKKNQTYLLLGGGLLAVLALRRR